MARLVALLRGINLGAKRRVPMADLRELMAELGYEDVRTVLQSGNVVFTGAKAKAQARRSRARWRIATASRSTSSCARWTSSTPSSTPTRSGDEADQPQAATSSSSSRARQGPRSPRSRARTSSPDKFAADGARALRLVPRGHAGQRLMRALGKPGLAETATVRNMSTVKKLLE